MLSSRQQIITTYISKLRQLLFLLAILSSQFSSAMAHQLNTEFVSNLPLEQSWKLAKHSDHILPKVLPHVFSKSERLEGDGGAGTVRIVTLGDGK